MKVKISITLGEELVSAIEAAAGSDSRSAFIERAAWEAIRRLRREARDRHDARIYGTYGPEYAAEALETLDDQYDDGE